MFTPGPQGSIELPLPPELPPTHRFPLIATLAPIVASAVLFAVTRSAFTLVFALLGPVVAVATTADAAVHRRRIRRRELARFARDVARTRIEIERAQAVERAELQRAYPAVAIPRGQSRSGAWRGDSRLATTIRVGSGESPSGVMIASPGRTSADPGIDDQLATLRRSAERLAGAPITADVAGGLGLIGPSVIVASVARGLVLQLASQLPPDAARIGAPAGPEWDWVAELPQVADRVESAATIRFTSPNLSVVIAIASDREGLPVELQDVLEVHGDGLAHLEPSGTTPRQLRPEFVSVESATGIARLLRAAASGAGFAGSHALPERIDLTELGGDEPGRGLSAHIGVAEHGPLAIDLVAHGPHAIIGGTTGSGKSELLVTWVLAMAAHRSPAQVTFLFVDFKGGAAFDPLLRLPHCVGVITDLDAEQSLRALTSLGAELRHRERELARLELRSIDDHPDAPPFPRLVVVVDEYAALVETHSSLHSVFADIAARGRSLGVHLVLCTQRPAGVVRDAILANCALRISLRVMAAADSSAVLGTDAAAALPARPIGRALISIAGEAPVAFQVARSQTEDGDRVAARWAAAPRPRAPWLPPLATCIELDVIDTTREPLPRDEIPFALEDRPEEQAQVPARLRPSVHGSLLIVGAARSGKTGVLTALASAPSELDVELLPREFPQLWDRLQDRPQTVGERDRLLLLDDLDAIAAGCEENYRGALLDQLAALLREGPSAGIHLVVAVQRVGGPLQSVIGLFGSLLLLRMPNLQEHVLAGGAASQYNAALPPGGGHWRGHRVQVFASTQRSEPPAPIPIGAVQLDLNTAALTVVSTRPGEFAKQLRLLAPARNVVVLGPARLDSSQDRLAVHAGGAPDIFVADPDCWQSQWSALATLQQSSDLLFDGCSLADLRAITRSRELPPPFARGQRALWLKRREGELVRARLPDSLASTGS